MASAKARRDDRDAALAHERAKVANQDHEPKAAESVDGARGSAGTWLRLQNGHPTYNPWLSPTFLVDAWSLPSDDVEVPALPVLPAPDVLARWRSICGLSVNAVAERAQVTPEMWANFEAGDETVRRHINELTLLKFASVMAACVEAGGPPVPVEAEPRPERAPMKVVGARVARRTRPRGGNAVPASPRHR